MRDIWGVPPGGFEATTKKKRPWLRATIAGTLVLSLGIGGGMMVSSMNRSTGVSTESALAEFRSQGGSSQVADSDDIAGKRPKADPRGRKKSRSTDRNVGAGSSGGSTTVDSASEQQVENETSRTGRSGRDAQTAAASNISPPAEGVYTWTIDGYEEAPGVHRRFPKRSNRIITHEGGNNWTEHHIFSEQTEEWFGLGMSKKGVFTRQVRNRVEMGPVTVDKTVVYDPVMFVSHFPTDVGETWDGSWEGKTSGEYKAKCFETGFLTIGGEKVEVFATEVFMRMRGDIEGTVTVRSWVSPEHRLVVKQYQESRVQTGPGEYHSEWTGQLNSLHPQT